MKSVVAQYDADHLLKRDDFLGKASVDLSPLLTSRELQVHAPLNEQGTISLLVSWEAGEFLSPPSPVRRRNDPSRAPSPARRE